MSMDKVQNMNLHIFNTFMVRLIEAFTHIRFSSIVFDVSQVLIHSRPQRSFDLSNILFLATFADYAIYKVRAFAAYIYCVWLKMCG